MGFFLRYGFAAGCARQDGRGDGWVRSFSGRSDDARQCCYASVGLAAVYAAIIVYQVVQLQRIG